MLIGKASECSRPRPQDIQEAQLSLTKPCSAVVQYAMVQLIPINMPLLYLLPPDMGLTVVIVIQL